MTTPGNMVSIPNMGQKVRMHLLRIGSEYLPVSKCIIFVLVHHAHCHSLEDRGTLEKALKMQLEMW
jgi:hypothetical protein